MERFWLIELSAIFFVNNRSGEIGTKLKWNIRHILMNEKTLENMANLWISYEVSRKGPRFFGYANLGL